METGKKTFIACAVVLGFFVGVYFLYMSSGMLLYLLVSVILAIAINPLVLRLKKMRMSRVWASLVSILALLAILCGIFAVLIVPLVKQGVVLAQNLPALSQKVLASPSLTTLDQKYHIASYIADASSNMSEILLGGGSSIIGVASNVINAVSGVTIILVLTFLLLIEGETIWKSVLGFLSEKNQQLATRVGGRVMRAISGFVSGNLLISGIAAVVTFLTLWILGVPYKLSLAALVALFDIIPLVGAAIATIVIGLVALTKSVLVAVVAVLVILIYQFIEGHIIQPIVYSRSIDLSALFIVIATLIGAEIGGIVGVLLAIPIAAVVQIFATELYVFFSEVKL